MVMKQQVDILNSLDRTDLSTRDFGQDLLELLARDTVTGRKGFHDLVTAVINSDWKAPKTPTGNEEIGRRLINSLAFEVMEHRQDALPKAHTNI